jgi:hypothetical protein
MGAHNDELHQSTRRIRAWMIRRIADATAPPPVIVARSKYPRGFGNVHELRSPASRKKAARK